MTLLSLLINSLLINKSNVTNKTNLHGSGGSEGAMVKW